MEHQALAELLGNYGEFLGAVAVVITLIYLALQVRQAHRSTSADISQRLNDEIANLNRDIYLNPEFAAFLRKAYSKNDIKELVPDEQDRVVWYFATVLNRVRQFNLLRDQKIVSEDRSQGALVFFVARPIFLSVWETQLRNLYPKDFVDYVEELIQRMKSP